MLPRNMLASIKKLTLHVLPGSWHWDHRLCFRRSQEPGETPSERALGACTPDTTYETTLNAAQIAHAERTRPRSHRPKRYLNVVATRQK